MSLPRYKVEHWPGYGSGYEMAQTGDWLVFDMQLNGTNLVCTTATEEWADQIAAALNAQEPVREALEIADRAASRVHDYVWQTADAPTLEEASGNVWVIHEALRPLLALLDATQKPPAVDFQVGPGAGPAVSLDPNILIGPGAVYDLDRGWHLEPPPQKPPAASG